MLGMTTEYHQSSPLVPPSQVFRGIRFLLIGFDPIKKYQVSRKLVNGGGVDSGQYGPDCTHVIVDKLVYDDPLCVAARKDEKILVSSLWVDHSFDVGAPVDTTSVMYVPVRNLNGIPGAKSLVICLTGYQREDREDIMTMVELMGAQVSKPLIANKVTHLICYKFEGEKYLLAKRVKRIKLINHRWLEDCLKAWEILPEADYSKSGYELEMEAEAKDSEDEREDVTTSHNETKIASPHHSLLSKQGIPNTISNISASNLFSNVQETVSVTMKATSDQFPNPHEVKITSEYSSHYEKAASSSAAQNNIFASVSANKSPQNEAKAVMSVSYPMKDSIRTTPIRGTPSAIDMESNTSSAKRLNKLNVSDACNASYNGSAFCSVNEQNDTSFNMRKMDVSCGSIKPQQASPYIDAKSAYQELKKDPPVEISPAKRSPSNISRGMPLSSKVKNIICDVPVPKISPSESDDLDAVLRPQKEYKDASLFTNSNNRDVGVAENVMELSSAVCSDLKSSISNMENNEQGTASNSKPIRKKSISKQFSAPIETCPAQNPPSNISGRKLLSSKGKNGICDETILKCSTSEIEDLNAVQGPQKEYKETDLSTKSSNRDVGMTGNVMQLPSVVSSDLQKSSTLNLEINEQSAGSSSKPGRKKSISKKFSAPKLSKKNTVNQKGSIFLKNLEPEIGNENLFKYQQFEHVSSVAKSGTKIEKGVVSGMQIENMVENASLCMDDETEPPDDKDEASKEKYEDGELENTVDVLMEEKAEGNVDVLDPSTDKNNDENELLSIKNKVPVHKSDGNFGDLVSEVPATKKGKKNTALSMKEVTDKKSGKKNEPVIDNKFGKQEIREEATPNRAKRARRDVNDLEKSKSMDVKRAGACNDLGYNNDKKDDDMDADMDIENAVNKKETKGTKRTPSKIKKDVSKRNGTDLEKKVVKRAGVFNDPKYGSDEKDDDVDADMDIENVLNKKETKKNKRSPGKTKKDVSAKNASDLEKPVDVERVEGVCKDPVHYNGKKDDDVDAEMDIENVLNKKETKKSKRPLSKTKKDVSTKTASGLEKSMDVERAEGVCNDPVHDNVNKDDDADADMGIENVVNKKETKRNKCLPSKTKKDANKRNATSLEKSVQVKGAGSNDPHHEKEEKDKDGADKDADVDSENVLKAKETKRNKRPLSRIKKDDARADNKKSKLTSIETCDLEKVQKENVQIHVNDQSTGNKHAFKPAKDAPEKNIDKVCADVLKDEPMWFILTGHRLQRREFQQIIRRLKGRVCRVTHNWSYQATHFIVPDPIKRTEKFFAAAASGRWILKTDYLSASNQAGKFLPEETYEWHKNGLSEDGQISLEAPRKWRLLKEKTGHGAFYGMKMVIYGECIAPPLDTLKRVVKAGDGTILATCPPYTRFLNTGIDFAVVSPGMPHVDVWVQEFLKHEIPCVTADYLVEYVCKPGYPLERHVQYGTNVWAERSYNELKNRFEEETVEPTTPNSSDVACEVCGARDRGEEMLICGDEGGLIGCGAGTHIDCCDPPLEGVPEEDWLRSPSTATIKRGSKNKGSASRCK